MKMKPKLQETFYLNWNIKFQEWFLKGKLHNEDGPAKIEYYESGAVRGQDWLLNGKWHNEEGPAWISYYENGKVKCKEWWFEDKQLYKKDFTSLDMIKRMDAFELFSPLEIARFKV
jgi:antitoxin component YwqK of YwqJK toxin-antitoxin module